MYKIKDIEKVFYMLDNSDMFECVDGISFNEDNCRLVYIHYYEDDDDNDVVIEQENGTWYCNKKYEELRELI